MSDQQLVSYANPVAVPGVPRQAENRDQSSAFAAYPETSNSAKPTPTNHTKPPRKRKNNAAENGESESKKHGGNTMPRVTVNKSELQTELARVKGELQGVLELNKHLKLQLEEERAQRRLLSDQLTRMSDTVNQVYQKLDLSRNEHVSDLKAHHQDTKMTASSLIAATAALNYLPPALKPSMPKHERDQMFHQFIAQHSNNKAPKAMGMYKQLCDTVREIKQDPQWGVSDDVKTKVGLLECEMEIIQSKLVGYAKQYPNVKLDFTQGQIVDTRTNLQMVD